MSPAPLAAGRLRLGFFVLAGLVFFVLPALLTLAADWQWFSEVGHLPVLTLSITARAVVGAAAFVLAAGWLLLNLRAGWEALADEPVSFTTRDGFTVALPSRAQLRPLAVLGGLLGALLLASYASNEWLTLVAWWRHVPFGNPDPVLGHDPAFYIYALPVLELVRNLGLAFVALGAIGSAALYALAGHLAMTPFGPRIGQRVWPHLGWLVAALFLVLALSAWIARAQYLVLPSGIIQGGGYADVQARMPAALALAVASLAGAALAVAAAVTRRSRWLVVAAALYVAVLMGGQIYAGLMQRFVVSPNEQAREAPYIEYNIAATRRAFALDAVEERELSGDAELTREDIARNRSTLDNVRLWDHQQLLETFGQIQEIRTYYDFVSVDNDRYAIGGQLRQVMLSARELNPAALPNRTWVNERLVFTHGHGLTLGPVNQVTSEGLPVLFVRDLPPVSTVDIQVREPSLYFGELSNDFVIARTRAHEFHYPKGDDNVFVDYNGSGGVALDSLLKKLLFAIYFRSYQILLSDDVTSESRLIFDRQIRRRVSKIAPFLVYDEDPYLVVSDGRLFWIQDAYTVAGRYPYSTEAARGVNYIRNSVKVVVDAYNGTTTFYLANGDDPLIRTLQAVFPGLLQPLDQMPEDLRRHVRYPEGIFNLQASVYSTYHMTSPAIFYNKEDQWEVPSIERAGESVRMEPYYTLMTLPGTSEPEFIQMLPFTPRRRDNLASWMVARSDGEHYGKIQVYQFPKQKLIFGPRQVVARINQDQLISPQITLWSQQGSEVIQGTLMVIPIEESLIYVRPLYLRAQAGRIPELTRVIVAYQNRIVMDRTLDAAIAQLFGTDGARPAAQPSPAESPAGAIELSPAPEPTLAELSAEARQTYDRALAAQKAGDWAKYGEEIRRLGEILGRMKP
jgi:uncharacterized membrane protein (UPF0182 family)